MREDIWVDDLNFESYQKNEIDFIDDSGKSCCVHSLTDRLAEERKKVVQEIRSKSYSLKNTPMYDEYGGVIGTFNRLDYGKLEKILDQIERGE